MPMSMPLILKGIIFNGLCRASDIYNIIFKFTACLYIHVIFFVEDCSGCSLVSINVDCILSEYWKKLLRLQS